MINHPNRRKTNGKERAVVVTTEHRGVFFGYAEDTDGDMIKLRAARNCEQISEVLEFLNSIEGAGYGGMASFEIARANVQDALAASPVCVEDQAPVVWVIPGNDTAREDGSIDAWAWENGEFSRPLYADPPQGMEHRASDAAALIARADKYFHTGSGEYASEIMRDMAEFIRRSEPQAAWTPIETAPIGERILLCWADHPVLAAHVELGKRSATGVYITYGKFFSGAPTHWMPLPLSQVSRPHRGTPT